MAEETAKKTYPQEAAEKYLEGNLPKPVDGYDGYQDGSSSLVNNATHKGVEAVPKPMAKKDFPPATNSQTLTEPKGGK